MLQGVRVCAACGWAWLDALRLDVTCERVQLLASAARYNEVFATTTYRSTHGALMSSLQFTEISPQDLDSFSASFPQGNFQQTSQMAAMRKSEGTQVEILAVKREGTVVAACVLETYHSLLSTFSVVHNGPLLDYHDEELVTFFFTQLKQRARKNGASQLEIIPETIYNLHNSDGSLMGDGFPAAGHNAGHDAGDGVLASRHGADHNAGHGSGDGAGDDSSLPAVSPVAFAREPEIATLEKLGFQHSGFTVGYTTIPRWRYLKDLSTIADEKALLASYSKNTRRNVKIAANSGVTVRAIGRDELPIFHHLCELACEKQGFDNRPLEYFQALYDNFGDKAQFMLATLDLKYYLEQWEAKKQKAEAEIARLQASLATSHYPESVHKKIATAQQTLTACENRIARAHEHIEQDGTTVDISAAMFVWHPRQAFYLFSGSDEKYAKFYGPTALQHWVMTESLKRGLTSYNFYGIDGVFDDPNSQGHGVLEFKQGFQGYVAEMTGQFSVVLKPVTYAMKQLAHHLLGR